MKQKTWTAVLVVAFLIVAVMQFRIMDETKKMGALLIDQEKYYLMRLESSVDRALEIRQRLSEKP